ncbi:PD-(D/E)XK nuclease superfamily protein [Thioalbus denitrificans]|jgi:hypothetical protein|uniref:PD-(D/E)XK nuclease domain-containing protein n=1 Tax=Thioalbus denitrificans TaxID=547122 RepID=A0A369CFM6_9GAMM|nr:PD-(D/E)XK nuclease superfamily protein [Thioalbus denitrificans]RCX32872.1 hypothetical protein DFQ59_101170 [Thioalbus denitrificans]
MRTRDTRTGAVHEVMVTHSLHSGGYTWQPQVLVGTRPNGRRHKVDLVADDRDRNRYLISLKWQQSSGTAEQKVPFEVICLKDALQFHPGRFRRAYLVLGGEGWTLRDFYVGGGLQRYMNCTGVEIVTLERFVALANRGQL